MIRSATHLVLVLALAVPAGGEGPWTNFRGPSDDGHASAADLPLHWSETENVAWKVELPGKAWSSPVIWGDRIWMTNATEDGTRLSVLCLDRHTGEVLLDRELKRVAEPQFCHPFNSYASPSPVLEEGRVYVSFGSPYNACLDAETGEVLWERDDFVCNHFRGAGSSPFIYEDLLILHFDGSDYQYIAALDKKTGETVWRTDRSVDFKDIDPSSGEPRAEGDFRKAFSTPIVVDHEGQPVLVSLGSTALYGYDPRTGRELWRVESTLEAHSGSARPVAGHGLIFSPMGYTGELWAVHPDGRIEWRHPRPATRRSSFVLVDGRLFGVDASGVAICVDALSGEEIWRARVGGNHSASPIHWQGRIYFFDESGTATIIEAGPHYEVLAVNELDDGFLASPAVSGNALYLRTRTALYRIENRAD